MAYAVLASGERPTALLLAAGALSVLGTTGVTMAGNVPLNNELENLDAQQATAGAWQRWVTSWTAWNHVRTLAALAAAAALIVALNG